MPYFEFHDTLPHHIKTRRLATALRKTRPEVIGHLACLFAYVIGARPHGEIEAVDIPIAAEWEGKGKVFVDALVASGWLDTVDGTLYRIHDWLHYTKAYRKAQKDSTARAEARLKRVGSATVAPPPPRTEQNDRNGTSGTNEQKERPAASPSVSFEDQVKKIYEDKGAKLAGGKS